MSAPVKHTCPDIDDAIKKVRSALKIASAGMRRHENGSDDWDNYDAIETDLMNLEGMLEDLRKDNSALREWGTELNDQLQGAAEDIQRLEGQIESLKVTV